ncbi:hypothetical protein ACKWTF_012883 [Chironomus riparius]
MNDVVGHSIHISIIVYIHSDIFECTYTELHLQMNTQNKYGKSLFEFIFWPHTKERNKKKGHNGKFGKTRIGHKRCCVFLFKMRLCMFVRYMESERCGNINQKLYIQT